MAELAATASNQSPPFADIDAFAVDLPLQAAVVREGGGEALDELGLIGRRCGSAEALERARLANIHPPVLRTHDAKGFRLDQVDFHPAYHDLMRESAEAGLHGRLWEPVDPARKSPLTGRYVARAAAFYMTAGLEAGHCCPITMTSAAVPALRAAPELADTWIDKIATRAYDPHHLPIDGKTSVTVGMGMTERQGGTDVRANETRAERAAELGETAYLLTGHKWFLSAPMSDGFLVLAQATGGLTCFLLPRMLPDGARNGLRFVRLKDKLGNRSNASSEVEFDRAVAWRVGPEGRGIATILEMVTETRLDCAIASAGLMRVALAEAVHHARHRRVFGQTLIRQPLMAQVLADMALDVEAATAIVFRLACASDRAQDPRAMAWRRLMTPVVKYWVCKIAPPLIGEAMECLGGNGYVEDSRLPRLYREAPVNSIWEGSGNVMGLDILRVLKTEPAAVESVLEDLSVAVGDDPTLKQAQRSVEAILGETRVLDLRVRELAERLALVTAGALLRAHAPAAVADAFTATRLGGNFRHTYGHGLAGADTGAIIARVLPD